MYTNCLLNKAKWCRIIKTDTYLNRLIQTYTETQEKSARNRLFHTGSFETLGSKLGHGTSSKFADVLYSPKESFKMTVLQSENETLS